VKYCIIDSSSRMQGRSAHCSAAVGNNSLSGAWHKYWRSRANVECDGVFFFCHMRGFCEGVLCLLAPFCHSCSSWGGSVSVCVCVGGCGGVCVLVVSCVGWVVVCGGVVGCVCGECVFVSVCGGVGGDWVCVCVCVCV